MGVSVAVGNGVSVEVGVGGMGVSVGGTGVFVGVGSGAVKVHPTHRMSRTDRMNRTHHLFNGALRDSEEYIFSS
jgi:hypothetical protein